MAPRKQYGSDTERVAASRVRRGGRQLNVYLDPPAAEALGRLAPGRGQTKTVIERLILDADRKAPPSR